MIFSGLHMLIRMIKEKNPDYSDIGIGFIFMGFSEMVMWTIVVMLLKAGGLL